MGNTLCSPVTTVSGLYPKKEIKSRAFDNNMINQMILSADVNDVGIDFVYVDNYNNLNCYNGDIKNDYTLFESYKQRLDIKPFIALCNNYYADMSKTDIVSTTNTTEQNAFLDALSEKPYFALLAKSIANNLVTTTNNYSTTSTILHLFPFKTPIIKNQALFGLYFFFGGFTFFFLFFSIVSLSLT